MNSVHHSIATHSMNYTLLTEHQTNRVETPGHIPEKLMGFWVNLPVPRDC